MSGPGLNLPHTDARDPALRLMRAAALLLGSVGLLNVVFGLVHALVTFAGMPLPWQAGAGDGSARSLLGHGLTAGVALVGGVLSCWGARCMVYLRNHGTALVGAVFAMLPVSPFCFVGLPIGVWLLTVLNRAPVKAAFSAPGPR